MRYGILTYHQIPNYGAVLQAYALCAAIRKLGYDCEIIDYQCENIVKRELSIPQYSNPIKRAAYQCLFGRTKKEKPRNVLTFCKNSIADSIIQRTRLGRLIVNMMSLFQART